MFLMVKTCREYENEHNKLNLLDVTIKNNLDQSYDFAVYRKPAISNVHSAFQHLPKHSYGSI